MVQQLYWLMKMRKSEMEKDLKSRKEYRRKIWSSGYWITADLNLIRWDKLEVGHAENILRMLERKAENYISKTLSSYYSGPEPRGDGAQDAYYSELDFWENGITSAQIVRGNSFYPWLVKRLEMENDR